MAVRVRVVGAQALRRVFARMTTDMHEVQEEVAEKWADAAYEGAVRDVPIDTGDLGSALEKRVRGSGSTADAEVGVWEDEEYYGQFVEFGTSKMAAQPFMYPNASAANRQVRGWVREGIEKRIG
ncbi:HK97-gp10 family putative phage morphogenesis protein [Allonocardiopsis opalescens]|uniref:HK97 gp10 family phage protein n=1 Tax=Allonocardiopsis opalescens TaxID=1144618 RepID=A0A2T0PPK9_9ACTN|nr:HK97-gp10 family putative phage morphogenesis protein [Allonocardiopsis opalescens]PRX90824.1 HK97 gp10 family phage protein [Allonocardiopsis opalescens]